MRTFVELLRIIYKLSVSRSFFIRAFGSCMVVVLTTGCASVPVAPKFDTLPPVMANLNLQIGGVEGPPMQKLGAASLEEALRPALFSALTAAGFHLVFDAQVADAIVDVTVDPHVFVPAPYRTTLTLRGPRGREIDEIKFTGGTIGGSYNRNAETFERIAHGIASNLVAKLIRSPIFLAFAGEPRSRRPIATSATDSKADRLPRIVSDVDVFNDRHLKVNKNAYAIVIGIEQYRKKFPEADYAENDARIVTDCLTKMIGYPRENVVTLINENAAMADFAKYFEKWLPNNVEAGSSVFVYYSGHGAPNLKTGDAYLVPYDGDPSFIDQTGYSLMRLYDALGKLPAKEVIVVLDSCFSGAGGRSVLAEGARPLVMISRKSFTVPANMTILAAASGDQISSTYKEKGHGLFTYFMLKGIKDEDIVKANGTIDITDLFRYLKPQVERIARKQYNNEQTPQLISSKKN